MPFNRNLIGRSQAAFVLALLAISGVTGCGSENNIVRLGISGSVTQTGGSVNGIIRFVPKKNGPAATTEIKAGKYAFTNEDGPIAGEYDVFVETTVHDKGSFLNAAKSANVPGKNSKSESVKLDIKNSAAKEWKFSATVNEKLLELKPFVLNKESAVTPE